MSLLSSVLFFGHDELLLLTRGRIFELAGFRVSFAQALHQVSPLIREHSVDLIVLCHTSSEAECTTVDGVAEKERIQVLRLLMTESEGGSRGDSATREGADGIFDWTRGPEALLNEACSMLRIERRWTPLEAILVFAPNPASDRSRFRGGMTDGAVRLMADPWDTRGDDEQKNYPTLTFIRMGQLCGCAAEFISSSK